MSLVTSLSFSFSICRISIKKKVNGLISTKGSINMSKCGNDVEEFLCVIMNIYREENIPWMVSESPMASVREPGSLGFQSCSTSFITLLSLSKRLIWLWLGLLICKMKIITVSPVCAITGINVAILVKHWTHTCEGLRLTLFHWPGLWQ